ncbi:putative membrane protein [Primorskyibacter sedentarius]|uniref:Putative membrane protein n=1 Tax=Primorskyibacter sedentarius TaxID=745311 RepID=A0A4R3IHG9_9RHOB|nr:anthrone oxygenase family protein [Primorskyibacter sedentarius]TCS47559.1 putative membrane protein [Primorskyibacter sedentarius]
MSTTFFILLQLSILAYALVAGVFLAFSDFIMRSLALTGGAGGVEAMQVINREVFRWVFMALFLGMAAVSLVIVGYGATNLAHPSGGMILLAGLLYLIGCFGVTVFFNVPMNEALAGMNLSEDATRAYWTRTYLPRWTFWNTVRTLACGASAALLLFGLLSMTQAQAAALQDVVR